MTVTSELNKQEFVGDGIETVFSFSIQAYQGVWINGYVDGVIQAGVVALNADQESSSGGTFTFDVAPPDLSTVTILRDVPLSQLVDFPDYGAFPARNNEDALDKVTMAMAQFLNVISGGEIDGPVLFNDFIALANNKGFIFKNANGSFDPNESGVYRLFNNDSDVFTIESSDGAGNFVAIFTIPALGKPILPFGASSDVAAVFDVDLMRKGESDINDQALQDQITSNDADITALQAVDADLQDQIDVHSGLITDNETDIADLQANKVSVAGDAMDGDLTLFTTGTPPTPSSAASKNYVDERVASVLGGLTYAGNWDASGNTLPVPSLPTGEFWIISVAGTLNLSVDGAVPVPTPVVADDKIVYDGATTYFNYVPNTVATTADQISFDPTGLNYTTVNVQAALAEADNSLFVHKTGNITDTINGIKIWESQQQWDVGIPNVFRGDRAIADSGDFSIIGGDITEFRKRNAAGDAWLPVMTVLANGALSVQAIAIFETETQTVNNASNIYRNNGNLAEGLGSKKIIQGASNNWLFQYHDGANWQNAITINEAGETIIPKLQIPSHVGQIIQTFSMDDPNTIGYAGTWALIENGTAIQAHDTPNPVATGDNQVTLATGNIPQMSLASGTATSSGDHGHGLSGGGTVLGTGAGEAAIGPGSATQVTTTNTIASAGAHTHPVTGTVGTGSPAAINVRGKYVLARTWHRTA